MNSLLLSVLVLLFIFAGSTATRAQTSLAAKNTEWVRNVLKDIQSIKLGMTRGQMRRVFAEQGGLSTVIWRTYVFRDCSYIKVDFTFKPHGPEIRDTDGRLKNSESDQDVIVGMSKPYLEFATID